MRKLIIIYVLSGIFFTSCVQPLYIPNTVNTPVLTKQGDIDASLTTGSNGWDVQGAYAVTDEIGLMLNTSFANHQDDSTDNFNRHLYIELGMGYNFFLNKKNYSEGDAKFIFSVFGGAGIGSSSGLYEYNDIITGNYHRNHNSGSYFKPFIQPAIGLSHKNIDLFFATRLGLVKFTEIRDNSGFIIPTITTKDYNIYYEPVMNLRFGGEKLKFMTQMGASVGQFGTYETLFRNRPLIFIIGLQLNTNVLGNK